MSGNRFEASALDLIRAIHHGDTLGYLRTMRDIENTGSEGVIIGELIGIILATLDEMYDGGANKIDQYLDGWITHMHEETQ